MRVTQLYLRVLAALRLVDRVLEIRIRRVNRLGVLCFRVLCDSGIAAGGKRLRGKHPKQTNCKNKLLHALTVARADCRG